MIRQLFFQSMKFWIEELAGINLKCNFSENTGVLSLKPNAKSKFCKLTAVSVQNVQV